MTVLDVPMIQTRGFRNRDGGGGFELRVRMSYIPEELQPTIWSEERRLVITR